jgi:hypothetical protein
LFLKALELYGYGNWEDISIYIQNKTLNDVEKHFWQCYLPFLDQENIQKRIQKLSSQQHKAKDFVPLLDQKMENMKEVIQEAE